MRQPQYLYSLSQCVTILFYILQAICEKHKQRYKISFHDQQYVSYFRITIIIILSRTTCYTASNNKKDIFMKVLIAPDSFKECLDAFSVTTALSIGLQRSGIADSAIVCRPLADGGEGLLEVLLHALGGEIRTLSVTGPMGEPVDARYGLLDTGKTAVIEMAQAAGLQLVPESNRNPAVATTRGVGELIRHTLDLEVQRIIVGVGGSATNDGGAGMATALGTTFLNATGNELPAGGAALRQLDHIDIERLDKRLQTTEIMVACDVSNTLCGLQGASHVYGPQKGATPEMVQALDEALSHYATVIGKALGGDILALTGGGAAGGLAAGLAVFCGATLRSGVELIFDAYGDMDRKIAEADSIITGEGVVDGQSAQGKVISGLAKRAKAANTPLITVAGKVGDNLEALYDAGVTAVFPIAPMPMPVDVAIKQAKQHLEQTGESLGRIISTLL